MLPRLTSACYILGLMSGQTDIHQVEPLSVAIGAGPRLPVGTRPVFAIH